MAQIQPNAFTSWKLTPEEFRAGMTFNIFQRYVIQSLIAEAALEKISLTFDPADPSVFIQREAELQGQINILQYLIADSLHPEENTEIQNSNEESHF